MQKRKEFFDASQKLPKVVGEKERKKVVVLQKDLFYKFGVMTQSLHRANIFKYVDMWSGWEGLS